MSAGRHRRRTAIVLSFVVAVSMAVASRTTPAADAADDGLSIAGRWTPEGIPAGADRAYVAPASRLIYLIVPGHSWARAYDLDTLAPASAPLALTAPVSAGITDPLSGDLLVGGPAANAVVRFGVRNGVLTRLAAVDLTSSLGPGTNVIGMHLGPRSKLLWLLATTGGGGFENGVKIAELDLGRLSAGQPSLNWVSDVTDDGCTIPLRSNPYINAGIGYVAATGALYFGCSVPAAPPLYQAPQGSGVGRLALSGDVNVGPTTPGAFRKFIRSGEFGTGESLVDAPSGRVVVTAYTASAKGVSMYVFDAVAGRFIGSVSGGTNDFVQTGLDPLKGRVYGLTQNTSLGFMASDIRATPPTQARLLPAAANAAKSAPRSATLPVDPVTGRAFLSYGESKEFVVVKDTVPAYVTPGVGDPDAGTDDVPEDPLRTRSTFSGSAQAYGSRYRSVGGPQNLWFNLTGVNLGDGEDREVRTAFLNAMSLGARQASASSIAADTDDAAKQQGWPYTLAQCSDFGDASKVSEVDGATVGCDAEKALVSSQSEAGPTSSGGFVVQKSGHRVGIRRDAERGTVVSVSSAADGVTVAGTSGLLSIGEVRVTSEAWAAGRSGTAGFSFRRVVKNVTFNGEPQCEGVCSLAELQALAGRLAADRIALEAPEPQHGASCTRPDETTLVCQGTPRGYQAVLRRDPLEQLEQVVLNNQPIDRVEVPGLVIASLTDNQRTSRTILELAGSAAEARYGISRNDLGGGDVDGALAPIVALQLGQDLAAPGGFPSSPGGRPSTPRGRASGPTTPAEAVLGFVFGGLSGLIRLFPVWVVLLAPVYLSARRALLLRRGVLLSEARS